MTRARIVMLLVLAGCDSHGTFVEVRFLQGTAPATVASIDLTATWLGGSRLVTLKHGDGSAIALPATTSLQPAGGIDSLTLDAVARAADGHELARGSSAATVVRGQTTIVELSFGSIMSLDGGAGDAALDGGSDADLGDGGPAALRIDTSSHDFGTLVQGAASAGFTFTIQNVGGGPTGPLSSQLSGSGAGGYRMTSACQGIGLDPGASCTVQVSFAPSVVGAQAAALMVGESSDDMVQASLTGTGAAALVMAPPGTDFGMVGTGTTSAATIFTISNTGPVATATLTAALGGPDAASFTLGPTTCGAALLPGRACQVQVRFAPPALGVARASLTVGDGVLAVTGPLAGEGVVPTAALELAPAMQAFGTVATGLSSAITTFTVSNPGTLTTGTLTLSLGGSDATEFTMLAPGGADCTATTTLAPRATCTVRVRFVPMTTGNKLALLQVMAGPGGMATAILSGAGTSPSAAALAVAPNSHDFGGVLIGASSAPFVFTVTNVGQSASSVLSLSLGGNDPGLFMIQPAASGDCAGQTLAPAASCVVQVVFSPAVRATAAATLTISATTGGILGVPLTGTGQQQAQLSAAVTSTNFGAVAVGQTSAAFTWTITNSGDVASGALAQTITGAASQFTVRAGVPACSGALAGGASCSVLVTFAPTAPGASSLMVSEAGAPGGSVTLSASGTTAMSLTVATIGAGLGGVSSAPVGINCPSQCTASYAYGTSVTLTASPGPSAFLESWSGDCAGSSRTCTVSMTAARSVTAKFSVRTSNIVFVSAATVPGNLGSAVAYDGRCQTFANAAGLSGTFIAWVSDATSNAITRLGPARGWVRLDGLPVADSMSDLLQNHRMWNPIRIAQNGQDVITGPVFTGTKRTTGTVGLTCNNWTVTTGTATGGGASIGGAVWTDQQAGTGTVTCGAAQIFCFQVDSVTPITPTPTPGKLIFLSNFPFAVAGGIAAANAKCNVEKPVGYPGTFKALLSTQTVPASSLITSSATYVSVEGQVVGIGAQLIAGAPLTSGIWQQGNGLYSAGGFRVFTGAPSLTSTAASCSNWVSTAGTTNVGFADGTGSWWMSGTLPCSDATSRIYCIEQ